MYLGIGLGITRLSGVLGFNPASLFASGEEGAWYDPSDLSTVWQDAAGTTPATAGDPVGRIDDKSGNGNHATQLIPTARPTLQVSSGLYYLDFDGMDDYLKTSSFVAISNPITVSTAVKPVVLNDFIFDGQSVNQMSLRLVNNAGVTSLRMLSSNSSAAILYVPTTANTDQVVRCVYDDTNSVLALNGVETSGAVASGTSVTAFTLGSHGSLSGYMTGRIYGFMGVDRTLTASEISGVESYLAAKSGVTL